MEETKEKTGTEIINPAVAEKEQIIEQLQKMIKLGQNKEFVGQIYISLGLLDLMRFRLAQIMLYPDRTKDDVIKWQDITKEKQNVAISKDGIFVSGPSFSVTVDTGGRRLQVLYDGPKLEVETGKNIHFLEFRSFIRPSGQILLTPSEVLQIMKF